MATLTPNLDTSDSNMDTSSNMATMTPNHDTSIGNHDTSTVNHDTINKLPKRLKKEELEKLILEKCKEEYFTIAQIAEKAERKSSYIQNEILPALIESGKLQRLYPTIPNHPHQAYKTAE